MSLAKQYAETKLIGVMGMGNWGGLEVLDIIYDADDYVVTCFNWGNVRKDFSKAKIRYTIRYGRPYFMKYGRRYHFDQIMRV